MIIMELLKKHQIIFFIISCIFKADFRNGSPPEGTLNTFRTEYYYQIIELSPQIERLNIELKTA